MDSLKCQTSAASPAEPGELLCWFSKGPHWGNHMQAGQTYGMHHLQPSVFDYLIPAIPRTKSKPGRVGLSVKMLLRYSHHCFTQALERVPDADPDHYYRCSLRGETRVFCTERWAQSKQLPVIVKGIKKCHFTPHQNYFIFRDPMAPAIGDYFVYFALKLNREKPLIELDIESAYCRLDREREKNAPVTSLNTLVANTARGIHTHAPMQGS
jgi:hypothetical protein